MACVAIREGPGSLEPTAARGPLRHVAPAHRLADPPEDVGHVAGDGLPQLPRRGPGRGASAACTIRQSLTLVLAIAFSEAKAWIVKNR